jgi:hypothetical protein
MDFVPAVATLALIIKLVDFLRYATNKDINGVVTQAVSWIAGVVVIMLVARTHWAAALDVGGVSLAHLGVWSQVFAGLTIASGASLAKDTLKAVDNHNTAAIPTLLPPGSSGPTQAG